MKPFYCRAWEDKQLSVDDSTAKNKILKIDTGEIGMHWLCVCLALTYTFTFCCCEFLNGVT